MTPGPGMAEGFDVGVTRVGPDLIVMQLRSHGENRPSYVAHLSVVEALNLARILAVSASPTRRSCLDDELDGILAPPDPTT